MKCAFRGCMELCESQHCRVRRERNASCWAGLPANTRVQPVWPAPYLQWETCGDSSFQNSRAPQLIPKATGILGSYPWPSLFRGTENINLTKSQNKPSGNSCTESIGAKLLCKLRNLYLCMMVSILNLFYAHTTVTTISCFSSATLQCTHKDILIQEKKRRNSMPQPFSLNSMRRGKPNWKSLIRRSVLQWWKQIKPKSVISVSFGFQQ